jgi:hypothetical protein
LLKEHEGEAGYQAGASYAGDAPNASLGILLTRRQTEAMAAALRKNERLWPYRYAILGALACDSIIDLDDTGKDLKVTHPYPMGAFLLKSFPGRHGRSEEVLVKELVGFEKKSEALRTKRQLAILGVKQPEGRVKKGLSGPAEGAPDRARPIARLRFVLDNMGEPVRPWSLDREKLLAVNDGVEGFTTHLTLSLWKEFLTETEDLDLLKAMKESDGKNPYYDVPLFDDPNRPVISSEDTSALNESIVERATAQKKACDSLAGKSRQALTSTPHSSSVPSLNNGAHF